MKSNSDTQRAVIYSVFCFLTFHSLNNVVVLDETLTRRRFRIERNEVNFPPRIDNKERIFYEFMMRKLMLIGTQKCFSRKSGISCFSFKVKLEIVKSSLTSH